MNCVLFYFFVEIILDIEIFHNTQRSADECNQQDNRLISNNRPKLLYTDVWILWCVSVYHEFPTDLWMLLKPEHNRLWGALLKALLWIYSHEYFMLHTYTFSLSVPSWLPSSYHMQSADTQEAGVWQFVYIGTSWGLSSLPQHDGNTWKVTVLERRREGESSKLACCLSAIKRQIWRCRPASHKTQKQMLYRQMIRVSPSVRLQLSQHVFWKVKGEKGYMLSSVGSQLSFQDNS